MKKFYLFFALLMSFASFGQASDLYISMYGEGGSFNKFIEIYNGTGADVDLTNYSFERYGNGSLTATETYNFSDGYILTSGDVFVIAHPQADATILAVADATDLVANFNGDDAEGLLKNGTLIDVIGVIGERPSSGGWDIAGVPAATKDHTLTRKATVCDPTTNWALSAGTDANDSQWIVTGKDTGWSDLGSFTGCSSSPTLVIIAPIDGQVFSPEVTDVTIGFVIQNFNVTQSGADGYIQYQVDTGSWIDKFNDTPLILTDLAAGSHTVNMKLVDNSGNDLDPMVEATVTFTIATYTEITTLADFKTAPLDNYYHFTGDAYVTAANTYESGDTTGWFQDATAGMMAFVPNGMTQNQPNIGDGITGVKGKLTNHYGVLELELSADFTMTGIVSVQAPQVLTIADYDANHDDYESELIKFENVTIEANGDTTFQSYTNYDVTDGTDTVVLRPTFIDLVDVTIPTTTVNITGIAGEYNGTAQIYPRDANDIETVQAIGENTIPGLEVYPNPVVNKQVFINSDDNSAKQVMIYDVLGKQVLNIEVNNAQAINVGTLKAGIYMMKIVENNRVALQKLIIK